MKNKHELSYRALKVTCNTNVFDFETTKDIEPIINYEDNLIIIKDDIIMLSV